MDNFDLQQHVTQPTRGDNFLDLVFTSVDCINSANVLPSVHKCDHDMILCCLTEFKKADGGYAVNGKRDFARADYGGIMTELRNIDWSVAFHTCVTPDDFWFAFKEILVCLINSFVPLHRPYKKNGRPNGDKRFSRLRRIKWRSWRKWKLAPTCENKVQFNMATRNLRRAILQNSSAYEDRVANKEPNQFFKLINNKLNHQQSAIVIRNSNGELESDAADICCQFSSYFKSLMTVSTSALVEAQTQDVQPEFRDIVFDKKTVLCVLAQMPKTAPGPDGIPAEFYHAVAASLVVPLIIIFQQSLYQRKVPQEWKASHVTPLYKGKGDRKEVSSYRAISLTPSISKIMERVVVDQLRTFLEHNGVLSNAQHGFRCARSCVTNMLSFENDLATALNDGINVRHNYARYSESV